MSHYSEHHYPKNDSEYLFHYPLFFSKGEKILDIGCSTGNFIAQDPKNIVGVDVDPDAIALARRRGFDAKVQKGSRLPFADNSWQNVHCKHVLEHIEDPLAFLKEIRRVMKKGGRLVLLTDKESKYFWDDYTHKRPFSQRSLHQLCVDAGFSNFKVSSYPTSGVPLLGFLLKRKALSPKNAKKLTLSYGRIANGNGLLLEAIK